MWWHSVHFTDEKEGREKRWIRCGWLWKQTPKAMRSVTVQLTFKRLKQQTIETHAYFKYKTYLTTQV